MSDVLDVIWHGLKDSFLMAWEVWWALVLGFAISGIVQAWVPRERIGGALSCSGARPVAWETCRGAAVAHNFRGDWQMLWKEITIGFFLAGFIAQLGDDFFNGLFVQNAPSAVTTIENVVVGPIIAVLSFVCSVGNVPLAAVLWSGGISFGGVLAFLFADLIVLPIIVAYRKYYGTAFALRITALMFVTMVVAALIVDGIFSGLDLIPTGARPSRGDIFGTITVNYKLFLNVLGVAIFATLFWL